MAGITKKGKAYRSMLMDWSWEYLWNNRHKFSDDNKIRIALDIAKRSTPQEIHGEGIATKVVNIVYGGKSGKPERVDNIPGTVPRALPTE